MIKQDINQKENLTEDLTDEELDAADVTGSTSSNKVSMSNTGCRPAPCGCQTFYYKLIVSGIYFQNFPENQATSESLSPERTLSTE